MTPSEDPELDTGIRDVLLKPLASFQDERGAVYRMLRSTDPHFAGFGEIYFSTVKPGAVKAWKRHRSLTASYVCVHGAIRMVLYDARPDSPTRGTTSETVLGPDAYRLLVVPPGVWNGFQGVSETLAIVANCASEPYDEREFERLVPTAAEIPYRWGAEIRSTPEPGT
jgi:dTDP-4-dehydrorhamnose 3,5-epimerase